MNKNKLNRYGFTLLELLIVVAIVTVLSGVAFVSVTNYQRSMTQMEWDSVAKEIFVAAQNHLTMAESQGYPGIDDPSYYGTLEPGQPATIPAGSADNRVYYYVVESSVVSGNALGMWNLMLPFGSIDELVRSKGSYIIRYRTNPGVVLDVFYRAPGTRFGSSVMNVKGYEGYPEILGLAGKGQEAQALKAIASTRKKLVVGWYGVADDDATKTDLDVVLKNPIVDVENGDQLKVTIEDLNFNASDPNNSENITPVGSLSLIVTGKTSGARAAFLLCNSGTPVSSTINPRVSYDATTHAYTVILDDVTRENMHFADLNQYSNTGGSAITDKVQYIAFDPGESGTAIQFIPGEDITVQAVSYSNKVYANIAYSSESTTNSLFADIEMSEEEAAKGELGKYDTALVSSFRHLENLDARISQLDMNDGDGVNDESTNDNRFDIHNVRQIDDLVWSDYVEAVGTVKEGETAKSVHVYLANETTANHNVTSDTGFHPVTPSYCKGSSVETIALSFSGQFEELDVSQNVVSTGGTEGGSGSGAEGGSGSGTEGGSGSGTEGGSTGGTGAGTTEEEEAPAKYHSISGLTISTNANAGLFGTLAPLSEIAGLELVDVSVTTTNGNAGALAGMLGVGSTVENVLVRNSDTYTATTNISAANGNAGGLIGTVGGDESSSGIVLPANPADYPVTTISKSAAAVYVAATDGNAGGLVGEVIGAGSAASNDKINAVVEDCYTGGHTEKGAYDDSSINVKAHSDKADTVVVAGGLIGTVSGTADVSYCYSTCSVDATGKKDPTAGGLIGQTPAANATTGLSTVSAQYCYAIGDVSASAGQTEGKDNPVNKGTLVGGGAMNDADGEAIKADWLKYAYTLDIDIDDLNERAVLSNAEFDALTSAQKAAQYAIAEPYDKSEEARRKSMTITGVDDEGVSTSTNAYLYDYLTLAQIHKLQMLDQLPEGYTEEQKNAKLEEYKNFLKTYNESLQKHVGDWASPSNKRLVVDTDLSLKNGDVLTAQVDMPKAQVEEGQVVTMLIGGDTSGQQAYISYVVEKQADGTLGVRIMDNSVIPGVTSTITTTGGVTTETPLTGNALTEALTAWQKAANVRLEPTVGGEPLAAGQTVADATTYSLKLDLDNITTIPKTDADGNVVKDDDGNVVYIDRHFSALFPTFIPGENLSVAAEGSAKTQEEMAEAFIAPKDATAAEKETFEVDNWSYTPVNDDGTPSTTQNTLAARTNSLFADLEIEDAAGETITGTNLTDPTQANAGITSIRHLENLDASISSLGKNNEKVSDATKRITVTDATQLAGGDAMDWDKFVENVGQAQTGTTEKVVNVYYKKADGTAALGADNGYIPVSPSQYTGTNKVEGTPLNYEGKSPKLDDDGKFEKEEGAIVYETPTIKGVTVDLTGEGQGGNAGLFGELTSSATVSSSVSNIALVNMVVKTQEIVKTIQTANGEEEVHQPASAGALVGKATRTTISNVQVYNDDKTLTENISTTGGNAGGLVGDLIGGSITESSASVYVSAQAIVDGDDITYGNAGGLVGGVNYHAHASATESATITDCYSGGHTSGGKYDPAHPNVQSNGANAGGLIGMASGTTTVEFCYSTSSADAKGETKDAAGATVATDASAGGLIGKVGEGTTDKVNADYCYALGDATAETSGTDKTAAHGALIGSGSENVGYITERNADGTVKSTRPQTADEAKYNHAINVDVDALTARVGMSSDDFDTHKDDFDPATAYDTTAEYHKTETGTGDNKKTTYYYDYPTLEQLHELVNKPYTGTSKVVESHIGDWPTEKLDVYTDLSLHNGDILYAQIDMPMDQLKDETTGALKDGQVITMLISGDTSERQTYLSIVLEKKTVNGKDELVPRIMDNSVIPGVTHDKDGNRLDLEGANGNKVSPTDEGYAALLNQVLADWQTAANLVKLEETFDGEKPTSGQTANTYSLKLNMDNIATEDGHFTQLFPEYTPGENITVIARGCEKTQSALDSDLSALTASDWKNNEADSEMPNWKSDKQDNPNTTLAAKTNSLFADIATYQETDSEGNVITNGTNLSAGIAGVSSIRHLENLDVSISNLGKKSDPDGGSVTISGATQVGNVDWDQFVGSVQRKDDTGNDLPVNVYKVVNGADGKPVKGPDNSYVPVAPSDHDHPNGIALTYNGQSPKMNDDGTVATVDDGDEDPDNDKAELESHTIKGIQIDMTGDGQTGGNAGLFGSLTGGGVHNVTLVDMAVNTKDGNAGALAGATKNAEISNVLVYNTTDSDTIRIKTNGGNAGGLVGDMTGGSINASAAAVYVEATKGSGTTPGGNAGGLVGAVKDDPDSNTDTAKISNSYSGGHTDHGAYATDKPNVRSSGANAGGLIGSASGETEVEYCYSTSSAGSDVAAGGLIGKVTPTVTGEGASATTTNTVTAKYCYALGDTFDTEANDGKTTKTGALVGDGTVTYTDSDGKSKTLTGDEAKYDHTINVDPVAVNNIANADIADKTPGDATVYDNTNHGTADSDGKYDYNHPTVLQLHELEAKDKNPSGNGTLSTNDPILELAKTAPAIKEHYGDWVDQKVAVDTNLKLNNGDILQAQVDIPKAQLTDGQVITMLIGGDSSGEEVYLSFVVKDNGDDTYSVELMDNSVIPGITTDENGDPRDDLDTILNGKPAEGETPAVKGWKDKANAKITVDSATGLASLTLDMDNIATPDGHFAQLFPTFVPGENLTVAAKGCAQTQAQMDDEFIYDSTATSKTQQEFETENWTYTPAGASTSNTLAARTNSLFADPSTDKVTDAEGNKVATGTNLGEHVAGVASIRHLENLDASISQLGKNNSKVEDASKQVTISQSTQIKDVDWSDFVNSVKGGDTTKHVNVYSFNDDGTSTTAGPQDSYIPVSPSKYSDTNNKVEPQQLNYSGYGPATAADGTVDTTSEPVTHTIKGVNIDLTKNNNGEAVTSGNVYGGNAGLFGELNGGSVSDLTLVDMEVKTRTITEDGKTKGNAGAVAGATTGTNISNVLVYNSNNSKTSNIQTTGGNAGGLVGDMSGGSITGSAAAVYVEATKGSGATPGGNAGGLVGKTSANGSDDVTITDSYSGGHTTNGDYPHDADGKLTHNSADVKSNGANAGGLIGSASDTTVTYCYSTSSASAKETGTDKNLSAGGLIGKVDGDDVSAHYSYALGDTGAPTYTGTDGKTKSNDGTLIGSGTINKTTQNPDGMSADKQKYSHTIDIPVDAVDDIKNSDQFTDSDKADGTPYELATHTHKKEDGQDKKDENGNVICVYEHPTVSQLHALDGVTTDSDYKDTAITTAHHGDWPTGDLGIDTDLSVRNDDILQAQVDMPAGDVAVGKIITMLIRGESSGSDEDVYLSFVVTGQNADGSYAVKLMDNSVIPGWTDSNDPTKTVEAWQEAAKATKITVDGNTASLTVDLDDISTENGHFTQLFPNLIPGENIEIIAEGAEKTKEELQGKLNTLVPDPTDTTVWDANNEIKGSTNNWANSSEKNTVAARTNSLFANPVVYDENGDPITKGTNLDEDSAGITCIRHLENLDSNISHVGENDDDRSDVHITKAEQIDDVDWGAFVNKVTDGDTTKDVYVYTVDADGNGQKGPKNSYIPVTPSNYNNDGTDKTNGLTYTGVPDDTGKNPEITGITINQPSGDAGLFGKLSDGSSVSQITLTDMTVTTGTAGASDKTGNAGAIAGTMENTTVTDVTVVNPTIISNNGNAGAIAGTTVGTNITNTLAYDDNKTGTTDIKATGGNAGGLVGDMTGGSITGSAAAVYVDATKGSGATPGGNAGGLVGAVTTNASNSTATITGSYSGGHTADGEYKGTPNVKSDGASAGGLIGTASGATTVEFCYSTSSAAATGTPADVAAGGLIGQTTGSGVSADNCYALGPVDAPENTSTHKSNEGTLIGKGTVNVGGGDPLTSDEAKYSHTIGEKINVDVVEQVAENSRDDAIPNDATGHNKLRTEDGKDIYAYDHPTIEQLYELAGVTAPTAVANSDVFDTHYGDWTTDKLSVDTDLKLNNGNTLNAQVIMDEEPKVGQIITMLIHGDSSDEEVYLSFVVVEKNGVKDIELMSNSVIPGWTDTDDVTSEEIKKEKLEQWKQATNANLGVDPTTGKHALTVTFDDITRPADATTGGLNGHFASLFPTFTPGENIAVEARGTEKTQKELSDSIPDKDAANANSWNYTDSDNDSHVLGQRTNSLFKSITDGSDTDDLPDTAEITSIRHLENLDPKVSGTNSSSPVITNVNQTENLDWEDFVDATGEIPTGSTEKVTNIVALDGTTGPDNGYIPVTPSNPLNYDAGGNKISNVEVKAPDENGNAGLFGELPGGSTVSNLELTGITIAPDPSSNCTNAGVIAGQIGEAGGDDKKSTVTNVTVNDPTVKVNGENGNAGAIAGTITNADITGTTTVSDPTIEANGKNSSAGGLGGKIEDGKITGDTNITNPQVEADGENSSAGGLAGTLDGTKIGTDGTTPSGTTTITAPDITAKGPNGDAGGLAGKAEDTTIVDAKVDGGSDGGRVTANGDAGGLIGEATGTSTDHMEITNAEVVGTTVSSKGTGTNDASDGNAGGLIATAKHVDVTNALVRNTPKTDPTDAEALAEATTVTVKATATNKGFTDGNAGGLIGYAVDCGVNKSAAAVIVNSKQSNAGGLIGTADGTSVTASYAGGHTTDGNYKDNKKDGSTVYNVTAQSSSASAGGLIGQSRSATLTSGEGENTTTTTKNTSVSYSYSTCSASGGTAGGLIGTADGGSISGKAYATGLVNGTTSAGAVAGSVTGTEVSGDVLYYDIINDGMAKTGSGAFTLKNEDSSVAAFDEKLSDYNEFVGAPSNWEDGHPYDPTLAANYKYKNGNKYNLKTVQQLGASVSETEYVDDHYGDWPSPETMVINTSA